MSSEPITPTDTRCLEELPKIDILGMAYTVDWKNKVLLPPERSKAGAINLDFLPFTKGITGLQFLYHPGHRMQVAIKASMAKLPAGVVVLEIPTPAVLDPVALAHEMKIPVEKILNYLPAQQKLSAHQVPWESSRIKEIMEQQQSKGNKKEDVPKARQKGKKL